MYRQISKLPTVVTKYSENLVNRNKISQEKISEIRSNIRKDLDKAQEVARSLQVPVELRDLVVLGRVG